MSGFSENFSTFAQGFFRFGDFKLSYITIYAAVATIFMWVLWNKTRFGKNVFAIGGNPEAAKVSGVNVARNLALIYMISGIFYAFGGMLEAGRIGSATNNLGFMYEMDAIAACVVGGVSFAGGVGTIIGVVTGVLIFTVINYGLTYIGVNPYWQYIIKGSIIIIAVAIDSLKYAKKKIIKNNDKKEPHFNNKVRFYFGMNSLNKKASLSARFINLIDYSYSSNHFNKIASRILSLDFIGSSSKPSNSQIHYVNP